MIRGWWLASLLLLGCGGGGSGATCPSTSTLTYTNFGQSFMASYCTGCHNSGRSDFSTLAGVRADSTAIDDNAAAGPARTNTAMPRGGNTPTTAERQQLGEWLACGAP